MSQFEDTRTFGPANSFVFTIDEPSGSFMRAAVPGPDQALGEWHMHCHVLDHMMSGMMGSLLIVAGGEAANPLPHGVPPGKQNSCAPPPPLEVHLTASEPLQSERPDVKMGDTVTWIWDTAVHAYGGLYGYTEGVRVPGLSSVAVHTFTHTFTAMGDFHYQCEVHGPPMTGTINVTM